MTNQALKLAKMLDKVALINEETDHQLHAINQMPLMGWVKLADELNVSRAMFGREQAARILAIHNLEHKGLL